MEQKRNPFANMAAILPAPSISRFTVSRVQHNHFYKQNPGPFFPGFCLLSVCIYHQKRINRRFMISQCIIPFENLQSANLADQQPAQVKGLPVGTEPPDPALIGPLIFAL